MVEHVIDWAAIRADYEAGRGSIRQLSEKYGVSKSVIGERKFKEQWKETGHGKKLLSISKSASKATSHHKPDTRTPEHDTPSRPVRFPVPDDAVSIARVGLTHLAKYLETDDMLALTEHKLLSDSLSQYVKVITTAPQTHEETTDWTVALNKLSPATRAKIRQALAEDEGIQREEAIG